MLLDYKMVISYPLYEELIQKCLETPDVEVDTQRLCATINKLGQIMDNPSLFEHYNEICALIIHHSCIVNNNFSPTKLPYDAKIMPGGKGVTFNSANIPLILKRIIMAYIETYA